jgi:bacterial/archaeal transporter family-2 protein
MILSLIIVTVIIGTLMPIQASINAELTRFIQHPYLGALISFATGTLALILLSVFQGLPLTDIKRVATAPPHLFVGGILGALFVGSSIYLIPRMGATMMIGSFVTGQLLMSVIMDHYGLFGVPLSPINWQRVVGVIMLFSGLLMVMRKVP